MEFSWNYHGNSIVAVRHPHDAPHGFDRNVQLNGSVRIELEPALAGTRGERAVSSRPSVTANLVRQRVDGVTSMGQKANQPRTGE
jgi:hypothetical protein